MSMLNHVAGRIVLLALAIVAGSASARGEIEGAIFEDPEQLAANTLAARRIEKYCNDADTRAFRYSTLLLLGKPKAEQLELANLLVAASVFPLLRCDGDGLAAFRQECDLEDSDCLAMAVYSVSDAHRPMARAVSVELIADHARSWNEACFDAEERLESISAGLRVTHGFRLAAAQLLVVEDFNACSSATVAIEDVERCYLARDFDCLARIADQWLDAVVEVPR